MNNEPFKVEEVINNTKEATDKGISDPECEEVEIPAVIRITQFFAFYGDDDHLYKWYAGCVVEDVEVIEELIERGVKYEVVEDDH